jgi:hypothetical protein
MAVVEENQCGVRTDLIGFGIPSSASSASMLAISIISLVGNGENSLF